MAMVQPQRMEDHVKQKRDSQQSRVYKWEKKFFLKKYNQEFTTLSRMQNFLDDVRKDLSLYEPIKVVRSRSDSDRAWAYYHNNTIALPWRCMTHADALHELSHHVVHHQMPRDLRCAGHGPEFVSVYAAMVQWYMGVPDSTLFGNMDKYKLEHDQYIFDHYAHMLRYSGHD